jgi:hypothetical protein
VSHQIVARAGGSLHFRLFVMPTVLSRGNGQIEPQIFVGFSTQFVKQ